MRRMFLTVLLGMGVVFGYGSAIASARWHARGGCHGEWSRDRSSRFQHPWERSRFEEARAATPAAAPAPVAPAAPAAQGLPQIIIVMPQAAQPAQVPQVVVTPAAAAVAPATN